MRTIEYAGTIGEELFARAQRLHLGRRRLILWLFPVVMTALPWSAGGPASRLLTFLICTSFPILMLRWQAREWRRIHRGTPAFASTLSGTVSESGINATSEAGSGTVPWKSMTAIKTIDDLMLLYQGPAMFTILAREFFRSDTDWQEVRSCAHQHVGRGA